MVDLGLTERTGSSYRITKNGLALIAHLESVAEARLGYAIIDVDHEVLHEFAFLDRLLSDVPVTPEYWDEMTSHAFSGGPAVPSHVPLDEFIERLREAYDLTRLSQFRQAETSAVREILQLPFLVRGKRLDFDAALEELIHEKPDLASRLASPRDSSAYLTLKGV